MGRHTAERHGAPSARWGAIALAAGLVATVASPARATPPAACVPSGELAFVCGVEDAEDLLLIPGTRFVVASGMGRDKPHGALHLIQLDTKAWRRWFPDQPLAVRRDAGFFADCAAPPDPTRFWSQGLSLRARPGGGWRLLVAGHGEREAVEAFDVDLADGQPRFAWVGCALMPAGLAANSVAATPDGGLLASVLFQPGKTMADNVEGRQTGGVYRRGPGEAAFQLIPGTEVSGDNGLEIAPDGQAFYLAAWGLKAVLRYSLAQPSRPPERVPLPFHPDNVHWSPDGRLVVAGMVADEPACGGPFKAVDGKVDLSCHRGYQVATIDPVSLGVEILSAGPANLAFANVSTALVVGDQLWLGSFRADRLAYQSLKEPR